MVQSVAERQEVLVCREIPVPKDRRGKTRSGELLRSIRQLVLAERGLSPGAERKLEEVGLRTRTDRETMEVILHYR